MFNLFKFMARKRVTDGVVATKEEVVVTPDRDEAFFKAHKGAREDVIYG